VLIMTGFDKTHPRHPFTIVDNIGKKIRTKHFELADYASH